MEKLPSVQREGPVSTVASGNVGEGKKIWLNKLNNFIDKLRFQGDWISESRGTLIIAASVIAQMTFQAALNPPGGVWGDNKTIGTGLNQKTVLAGTPVLATQYRGPFKAFTTSNTISFISSLSSFLLLISGFPIANSICTWILTITMCITLLSLGVAYLIAIHMLLYKAETLNFPVFGVLVFAFLVVIVLVGFTHTIRFVFWLINKFIHKVKAKFGFRRRHMMIPKFP